VKILDTLALGDLLPRLIAPNVPIVCLALLASGLVCRKCEIFQTFALAQSDFLKKMSQTNVAIRRLSLEASRMLSQFQ
jgi:hypothetical protein